ncbi:hypothetical protein QJS10_CPA06g00209 [Acorus calamus]|uniref:Uncharacterized protein n=1 Tax=Acorus calamus TaxID=4465 RepID=A0AAV9EI77_ACOCL|nr:hypothetical protein QJS10_CPA06g00209 [Acorus calamus]
MNPMKKVRVVCVGLLLLLVVGLCTEARTITGHAKGGGGGGDGGSSGRGGANGGGGGGESGFGSGLGYGQGTNYGRAGHGGLPCLSSQC